MKIGLDYDDTYTADEQLWDLFIADAEDKGHQVWVVTNRQPPDEDPLNEEVYNVPVDAERIVFTSGTAKDKFVKKNYGVDIDVWIDDHPEWIKEDMID